MPEDKFHLFSIPSNGHWGARRRGLGKFGFFSKYSLAASLQQICSLSKLEPCNFATMSASHQNGRLGFELEACVLESYLCLPSGHILCQLNICGECNFFLIFATEWLLKDLPKSKHFHQHTRTGLAKKKKISRVSLQACCGCARLAK